MSVRYQRQQLRRSQAKRSPTRTSRPASRTSGRAAAKNSSARSRDLDPRGRRAAAPAKAPNDDAHDAATLPHSSAAPTRHDRWAVSTSGARWPSISAAWSVGDVRRRRHGRRRGEAHGVRTAPAERDRGRRRSDVDHGVGQQPRPDRRRWRCGTRSPARTATSPRRRGRCPGRPSCRRRRRRGGRRRRPGGRTAATRPPASPIVIAQVVDRRRQLVDDSPAVGRRHRFLHPRGRQRLAVSWLPDRRSPPPSNPCGAVASWRSAPR